MNGKANRVKSSTMRSFGLIALLVLGCPGGAVAQDTGASPRNHCTESTRLLATGCPTLELTGLYLVESWDFNGRPKDLLEGGTAALSLTVRDGWGVAIELVGMRVDQKPSNAFVGGLSILFRKRLGEGTRRLTFFVEGGLGVSYATLEVPLRGTQFNYLVQAGGGATHRLGRRASAILDLRYFHLSNASLNGPDHNPDIQALGGHAGILLWF